MKTVLLALSVALLATACSSGPEPTPDQVADALNHQMSQGGIPCDVLTYSHVKVDSRKQLSKSVALLHVDMNVKLDKNKFTPQCKKFMGDSMHKAAVQMAIGMQVAKLGANTSENHWQPSHYPVKLTKTNEKWRVIKN